MKRASIRVQEPTPELIEKIRRASLSANPGQGADFFPSRGQYLPNGRAGFFPLHGAEIARK